MPIPKTRTELVGSLVKSYEQLQDELDAAGPRAGNLPCVDDWSVKQLLAVRAWWTTSVIDWIHAGLRSEAPVTPAAGYGWRETPRLNADIARRSKRDSYRAVRRRLSEGYARVLPTIELLNDRQLLKPHVFTWAGDWPISRWISINTTRQYTTARTFIRRALREQR